MAAPASAAPPRGDHPPTAAEQKLFAEGMRLAEAGDAVGAARAFRSGYEVAHDPAFLVRMGEAQEKAPDRPAAIESYRQYLRDSPDAADRDDIASRVRRLSPPGSAASEEHPTRELAGPVAPPQSEATGPSTAPAATAPPAAAAALPVAPAPPASRPPTAQVDEEESLRAFADENPAPRTRMGTAAWIGAGITVALLGVAAFYGAKASEKASDVDRLLRNFDPSTGIPVEYASVAGAYESDVREGRHDDRVAKGFAVAAGATALTTVALFVIDAVSSPEPAGEKLHAAMLPMATSHGTGMGVGWTF